MRPHVAGAWTLRKRQLAFALAAAAVADEAVEEEDEEAPADEAVLAAALPSPPDDLLSLDALPSELSGLDVLALLALSSELFAEPGLP
jgi:hypothetical protein